MNDELLILLVERYEELYHLKHPHYSNAQRRDNIWEEIGSILKQDGTACRVRWARIRENYRKAINLRKTKSGQGASKFKAPKFNKELSFLVPYLDDDENRRSNISASETEEDERDAPLADRFGESIGVYTSTPADSPNLRDASSNKRKRPANDESAASVLKEYLSSRERGQTATSSATATDSPLTHFFITMAKTVETFPLQEQIKIKSDIFQIVNNAELRLARITPSCNEPVRNPQPSTSQNLPVNPLKQITITKDMIFNINEINK